MATPVRYQDLPLSAAQARRIEDGSMLREILVLPPSEIPKQLRARWRGLPATLTKLAKLLLKATPVRCATSGAERWLLLEHLSLPKVARGSRLHPSDFEPQRITLWLPQPIARDRVERALRAVKQKPAPDLVHFFAAFGALRISEPRLAGGFELPSPESVFPAAGDAIFATWATLPKWKGSTIIYRAPNGDRLLLHPSGRTAWAQLERGAIVPFTPSFSEAVEAFRSCVDHSTIFDSWDRR
jgi:hypothetical protein